MKANQLSTILLGTVLALMHAGHALAQIPSQLSGVYAVDETVTFTISYRGESGTETATETVSGVVVTQDGNLLSYEVDRPELGVGIKRTMTLSGSNIVAVSGQWVFFQIPGATVTREEVTSVSGTAQPGRISLRLTVRISGTLEGDPFTIITNSVATFTTTTVAVSNTGRLINLSILTEIGQAREDFTMGYVVGGRGTSGSKPVVIRAVGPSLAALGVSGVIADPRLELFSGATKREENDDWGGARLVSEAMSAVGAFPFVAANSFDAAIATSVSSGDNSVRVSGVGSHTGTVLAEIYDATSPQLFTPSTPRLINLSVLKPLRSGFTVGFVVGGSGGKRVLVRAIGPTLGSAFGVSGSVSDPRLTLYSRQTVVGSNDNWGGTAALSEVFAAVGAFALPQTSRDAAMLATLQPGSYTLEIRASGGGTGLVLVEVYEVDDSSVNPSEIDLLPTRGLVAYWGFEGNANDLSGNGHHGRTAGGVTFQTGAVGQAVKLDGSSGYIRVPDFNITPTSSRSVCVWVKQEAVFRGTQEILSNHASPADCEYLIRTAADGKYDFLWTIGGQLYDGSRGAAGGDDSLGLVEPSAGQWNFLVLTYDGSSIRFYNNGTLVRAIRANGNIANASQDLFFGSYAWAQSYGGGPTNKFRGLVDEVRIYNRALSDTEVQALHAAVAR